MKQFYLLIAFFATQIILSQNFTDTKGELQISISGTTTYSLPIALPPSIKNVAPVINLAYSSGMRGGIAGQGWNINSISSISRIGTRRDIDDFVDGVDFDADDKLALDGQRLILKSGTYWATGSTYETEYKSNTKIELKIENGGAFTLFIVTSPDGSRTWYGSLGSGSYQNAVSTNAWYIVRFEDANGNAIEYNYSNVVYNNTNQLYIDNIKFSGNGTAGIATQNEIKFYYVAANRVERDFIKGVPVYASLILDNIEVKTNNTIFRKYQLYRSTDSVLGYERIVKIQESNGQGELSNPVEFAYDTTPLSTTRTEKAYINNLNFSETDLAGDFDGDGRLDFVANNQIYKNLFEESTGAAPINLPFTGSKRQQFAGSTISNSRLNQFQSIVYADESPNSISFKSYNLSSGGTVDLGQTKTISFDNSIPINTAFNTFVDDYIYYSYPNVTVTYPNQKSSNEYIEGDFNGDGISEVLVVSSINETCYSTAYGYTSHGYDDEGNYIELSRTTAEYTIHTMSDPTHNFFLVNLDSNSGSTIGSQGYVKLDNANLLEGDKRYIADFNSDGKSDILIVNNNKTYKIVSFRQLTVSPWVVLEVIGSGTLDKYSSTKQILFGDYNGDGKTDLMLPDSEGGMGQSLWHTYYGNPKPAGGDFFVKESQNIVEYWPNTGSYYSTQTHLSNYYAIDINGDGKSDLVRVWRKYYKPQWTINDHNTQWQVTAFTNNIGKMGASGFTQTYDSGIFDSPSPDIPIPITSNYKYQGANTELVIVRGHYNRIEYYKFNKNVNTENRLKSVTESSGNIKQTIDYLPMEAPGGGFGNAATDFYSSSNTAMYPDIELIRNTNSYLVSKLTATINGLTKYQSFKYRGYISNYNYGTVGFARTSRSSWYLSEPDTKIWTTQNNDTTLKGATTITWTSTDPTTVFSTTPTSLLSTKTNVFATYTNPVSKVYNVLLTSQTTLDALSGIKSESTYTYDGTVTSASYYGLQTQSINKQYSGSSLQGTTTSVTTYENNPSGTGTDYYIGRPKSTSSTISIYTGDSRSSGEIYTYTGTNLTKTEKTGDNTYAIIEDMAYDGVGNLLTKTVSAPGAPTTVTPRTITDEYDATKRFVIKKTDHQGFITNYVYNSLGQVTQSTDYLGAISDFSYDNWGKLTTSTLTNTSATPLVTNTSYSKLSDGGYTVTTTNNTEGQSIVRYDVLGRAMINTVNGFTTGSTISKQIVYDALGRKLKESEPYFSSPSLWTEYEYDYLQRPTKITSPSYKVQTITYEGLTSTVNDDGKVSSATVDALGNKTQTTDPGGTINFVYYATGQLKESDYQGNKITIGIDGWGNKSSMTDPNAGTYTYTYDGFGQIKTETTPNGTTSYVYDSSGKVTEKTIVGTNTNSKTVYAYNTKNQLTSTVFSNLIEGNNTVSSFEYDSYNKLKKTTESTPYATFIKQLTYDIYGRVDKETSEASTAGKSSTKTIKNTYKNGFPWQILDDETQKVLWQTNTLNERGQLTTATLGNDIAMTNTYDIYGYATQLKHDYTGTNPVNVMTLNTVFDTKKGNLSSRTNSLFSWNESFDYDNQDRLLTYNNAQGQQQTQGYDVKGKISQNNVGTYNYDISGKTYQNSSVTVTADALAYYTSKPVQNISYNTFKSPVQIEEQGIDKISFTYNDSNNRSAMFYGSLDDDKLLRPNRKFYSADGSMEIKQNISTGVVEFVTYIGGDGYTAPIVLKSDGTTQNYLYLHRDYQGSIVAITNASGVVIEKRLFDAWGSILKVQDGVGNVLTGLTVLDRGYTGHEHMQSVGLINMNGRLYDPKLHRFLQPDNFVQQLENTQNYNRYAYVLNNPLKYTDPSGEIIPFVAAVLIASAVSAVTYTMTALLSDVPFSVGGLAKATFIGAASAAVTFGIGEACSTITNFFARSAVQAVAHGTFQGGMTAISGGKFWSGFAAGALSSIASSAWSGGGETSNYHGAGSFANSDVGMIAFGTVSGGVGAQLTGGNFWQGAATGLVVSGLNHAMHKIDEPDDIVRINTKDKTATVEKTGDDYDRIFVNGKEIMATPRGALAGDLNDNGYSVSMKGPQGVGMGLTDLALDAFNLITGAVELKMGITTISKASLGLKVGLGGSKGTLKSSVFYTRTLGINAKMPFRLPTIVGAPTNNLGLFLGRNSSVFGGARMSSGAYGIFNNN